MAEANTGPPLPELVEPVVIARASAVLPAAGAFDSAPTEFPVAGFESMTLYIEYTRGAALGAMDWRVELSDAASGDSWYQEIHAPLDPTITPGTEVLFPIGVMRRSYTALGATIEKFKMEIDKARQQTYGSG